MIWNVGAVPLRFILHQLTALRRDRENRYPEQITFGRIFGEDVSVACSRDLFVNHACSLIPVVYIRVRTTSLGIDPELVSLRHA